MTTTRLQNGASYSWPVLLRKAVDLVFRFYFDAVAQLRALNENRSPPHNW